MVQKKKKIKTEEKNLIQEDNWSWQRFFMMIIMLMSGMAVSVVSGVIKKNNTGDILALLFASSLFLIIFILGMEMYRLQEGCFYEKANNYVRIAIGHGICCLATLLILFLPEYARPVSVLAVTMTIVTNSFLGMIAGIFYVVVLAVSCSGNIYQMLWAILILICSCIMVDFLKGKENRKWVALIIAVFILGCTVIFSYLETGKISINMISYGMGNGAVSAAAVIFLHKQLIERMSYSREYELERIISEEFGLVQAVKNFSRADYEHARKVSEISAACVEILGGDPYVAAAGGFYYRIGRLEGKPYVENGVMLAKSNYFPMQIVQILSEYNGEKNLPSTVESAVVHIVDSVVAKFDVLDKTTLSSSWNQDILVYQTLNENSAAGLYDKAGFSMNMFLKIRDYLIKEAELL